MTERELRERLAPLFPRSPQWRIDAWAGGFCECCETCAPEERQRYLEEALETLAYVAVHLGADTAQALGDALEPGTVDSRELLWPALCIAGGMDVGEAASLVHWGIFQDGPAVEDHREPGQLGLYTIDTYGRRLSFLTDRAQSAGSELPELCAEAAEQPAEDPDAFLRRTAGDTGRHLYLLPDKARPDLDLLLRAGTAVAFHTTYQAQSRDEDTRFNPNLAGQGPGAGMLYG